MHDLSAFVKFAHPSRRLFLQLLAGLVVGGATGFAYSRFFEPNWLDTTFVSLSLPGLPENLSGKVIAQLSDLHLCEFTAPERLAEAITLVNRIQPDWLVLTGDYVGDHAGDAAGLVEPLRSANAPIYAVYGNHDYWSDVGIVTKMLREAGATILRNAALPLAADFWLAGVDDLWSGRPDLKLALRDIPESATTILLAHEPDFFEQVLHQQAPVAVQLSGHSHGGQVRLPQLHPGPDGLRSYAPILPPHGRRYPIGLRQIQTRTVYTNRGLGVWPLPYRLNCRPELTCFTLHSAP